MAEIVICKACKKKEYWNAMTWLDGRDYCRSCYKKAYLSTYSKPYRWYDKEYTQEELEELGR